MKPEIATLFSAATSGDRGSLARLLTLIERDSEVEQTLSNQLAQYETAAFVLGFTGPPGAGKSSLISALLPQVCAASNRVAVLAVDPSSPVSGGALLGDRVRMQKSARDANVFIRSMASRGEQGGLARTTDTAVRLLSHCGWETIFIETLGIGQVELDVVAIATLVVVVLYPDWGDSFQANKAGLTEIGDLFVVNKADKAGALQTRSDLQDSLALLNAKIAPPVLETIATADKGLDTLWLSLLAHRKNLRVEGILDQRRDVRKTVQARKALSREVGRQLDEYLESQEGSELLDAFLKGTISLTDVAAHFHARGPLT